MRGLRFVNQKLGKRISRVRELTRRRTVARSLPLPPRKEKSR